MIALSAQLRALLVAEAERARIAVSADCAAISRWERDAGVLRTLVNVGVLLPEYERFPADEVYPLDSFPAVARLLRSRTAYLDPDDLASLALAAAEGYVSHGAVPIVVAGRCWGELWIARCTGGTRFTGGDIDQLHLVADRLGDALEPYV
jgi:GAF domain-containing protein